MRNFRLRPEVVYEYDERKETEIEKEIQQKKVKEISTKKEVSTKPTSFKKYFFFDYTKIHRISGRCTSRYPYQRYGFWMHQ